MIDTIAFRPRTGNKLRVNISIDPGVLREMDETARRLGCSRSELIEYCYRYSVFANPNMGGGGTRG